jgi:hypothetical protein
MGKDEETEELIKIFVTSIKTAEKERKWPLIHEQSTIQYE